MQKNTWLGLTEKVFFYIMQVKKIVRIPQTCSHVFIDLKNKNWKYSIAIIQSNFDRLFIGFKR